MIFCVKEKLDALKRPIVKGQMSYSVKILGSKEDTTPQFCFDTEGNTEFKLISAVAFVAITAIIICAAHKLCRVIHIK